MTFVCPSCGYLDSPIWKPLFWKLYGSYADFNDFCREHPELLQKLNDVVKKGKIKFEDKYFDYEFRGKTRKVIHRFPKAFRMMRNKKLYEKTPSETGMPDLFQKKIGDFPFAP